MEEPRQCVPPGEEAWREATARAMGELQSLLSALVSGWEASALAAAYPTLLEAETALLTLLESPLADEVHPALRSVQAAAVCALTGCSKPSLTRLPIARSAAASLAAEVVAYESALSRSIGVAFDSTRYSYSYSRNIGTLTESQALLSQLSLDNSRVPVKLLKLVRSTEQQAALGDLPFRLTSAAAAAVLNSGSLAYLVTQAVSSSTPDKVMLQTIGDYSDLLDGLTALSKGTPRALCRAAQHHGDA